LLSSHSQDDRNIPDGLWMQVDNLLIFDQVKRKIWAIAISKPHMSK
jgi:anthranilate synthase component I